MVLDKHLTLKFGVLISAKASNINKIIPTLCFFKIDAAIMRYPPAQCKMNFFSLWNSASDY
jgi:hypothetical protein